MQPNKIMLVGPLGHFGRAAKLGQHPVSPSSGLNLGGQQQLDAFGHRRAASREDKIR